MQNIILDTFSNQRVSDVIAQERIYTTCRHIVSLTEVENENTAEFAKLVDLFIEYDFYCLRETFSEHDTNTLTICLTEHYNMSPSVYDIALSDIATAYTTFLDTIMLFHLEDVDEDAAESFVDAVKFVVTDAIEKHLATLER